MNLSIIATLHINKGGKPTKKVNNTTIIIFLITVMFWSCTPKKKSHKITTQPQIKIEKINSTQLKFLNAWYKIKDNNIVVEGRIENRSARIIPGIFVTAKFYDSKKELIDTENKYTIGSIRRKHYRKSKYTIKTNYNPKIVLCKLELGWDQEK